MCYNNVMYFYDYLGREPKHVNGGASMNSGLPPIKDSDDAHFKKLADKAAGGKDTGEITPSGKNLLDYIKKLSADNCCIKSLLLAGHGWATGANDPHGIPGDGSGRGFYDDGTNWAYKADSATMSDLKKDITDGKAVFCKECTIKIYGCHISSKFAKSLGETTKCKVIYAAGSCSSNADGTWHSGPGFDDEGDNNPENGFRESDGGKPDVSLSNDYNPW